MNSILELYNTLTKQKTKVRPSNGEYITLYTCGPTVYDYAHIGNFRTYIFEDLLKRTLLFLGYSVKHVMNITDVEDKTIKGAISKNISLDEYTKKYTKAFFEDIEKLNIKSADFYPEATKFIKQMIKIIEDLLAKKIAYKGNDGSIYFAIKKFASYGKLSHLKLEQLQTGASQRVVLDEYEKENASDFVLWKSYDKKRDGNIFWDSPFGRGRPGWHIECSAMSLALLGEVIDIHCGGIDNIFPHHENEIAQSEAYTGKEFVKCWAHSEHLVVNNKKMSKSLGNFYTLRNLLDKGFNALQIRYLLLSVHYRMPLNFTFEGLEAAKNSLERISDFINRLKRIKNTSDSGLVEKSIEKAKQSFLHALIDDLNISSALAALFDFIREINSFYDENKIGDNEAKSIFDFLCELDEVLGFLPIKQKDMKISEDIKKALQEREKERKEKNYKKADELRDYILAQGYIIEDSDNGPVLKKK